MAEALPARNSAACSHIRVRAPLCSAPRRMACPLRAAIWPVRPPDSHLVEGGRGVDLLGLDHLGGREEAGRGGAMRVSLLVLLSHPGLLLLPGREAGGRRLARVVERRGGSNDGLGERQAERHHHGNVGSGRDEGVRGAAKTERRDDNLGRPVCPCNQTNAPSTRQEQPRTQPQGLLGVSRILSCPCRARQTPLQPRAVGQAQHQGTRFRHGNRGPHGSRLMPPAIMSPRANCASRFRPERGRQPRVRGAARRPPRSTCISEPKCPKTGS